MEGFKMLEKKLDVRLDQKESLGKSLLGRIKDSAVKYTGKAAISAAIVLGSANYIGCGNDGPTEVCYKDDACSGIYYSGAGCASDESCECSKPTGAPESQCDCYCVDLYEKEPVDKGFTKK